jgi:hypothetical protein
MYVEAFGAGFGFGLFKEDAFSGILAETKKFSFLERYLLLALAFVDGPACSVFFFPIERKLKRSKNFMNIVDVKNTY